LAILEPDVDLHVGVACGSSRCSVAVHSRWI
jgi:hypothetical protein